MAGKIVFRYTPRKGWVIIVPSDGPPPTINYNGQTIQGVKADQVGGSYKGHEGYQWAFKGLPASAGGEANLSWGGSSMGINLNAGTEYRTETGSIGGLDAAPNKATGGAGYGGAGYGGGGDYEADGRPNTDGIGGGYGPGGAAGGQFAPGNIGYGAYPAYVPFPNAFLAQTAPYKYTDPFKFADKFGAFNRKETLKNYQLGTDMALDTLGKELQVLQGYIPAQAALKRQETSLDNTFNQRERTRQVDGTLPELRGDLNAQGDRARTYAEGRVPDEVTDRALELGTRSNAADIGTATGFGAAGIAGQKISNLMSAEKRIQLSQYGDQALTQNMQNKASLLLAPTSYSNAGQQINVNPTVSPTQLISQNLSMLNQQSGLPTSQAFQSEIGQQQFGTNLEQQTRLFNTGNQNTFALGEHSYNAGYAGTLAGASQTNINTELGLQQQQMYRDVFEQNREQAQDQQTTQDIFGGIGQLVQGFGGVSGIMDIFGSIFGGGGSSGDAEQGYFDDVYGGIFGSSGDSDFGFSSGGSDFDTGAAEYDTGSNVESDADYDSFALNRSAPISSKLAGLSKTGGAGYQLQGYNTNGSPVYAKTALAQSNDPALGNQFVQSLGKILSPLKVFSNPEDSARFGKIGTVASDPRFISQLDNAFASGNENEFSSLLNSQFVPYNESTQSTLDGSKGGRQVKGGVDAAFDIAEAFRNWSNLSPSQKAMTIAGIGISSYQTITGTNLAKMPVIQGTANTPGLNVGQALNLFGQGVNIYSLVDNWGDLNNAQRLMGGASTGLGLAQTANQMGLLGSAVKGISAAGLAQAGWASAPSVASGAITSTVAGATLPAGYTVVGTQAGTTVAVPTAMAENAAAIREGFTYLAMANSAYSGYKNAQNALGQEDAGAAAIKGAQNVALDYVTGGIGSSIRGLIDKHVPKLGKAIDDISMWQFKILGLDDNVEKLVGGLFTGKSKNQGMRDVLRNKFFKPIGLIDDDYIFKFKDGSTYDLGKDGSHYKGDNAIDPEKHGAVMSQADALADKLGLKGSAKENFTKMATHLSADGITDPKQQMNRFREFESQVAGGINRQGQTRKAATENPEEYKQFLKAYNKRGQLKMNINDNARTAINKDLEKYGLTGEVSSDPYEAYNQYKGGGQKPRNEVGGSALQAGVNKMAKDNPFFNGASIMSSLAKLESAGDGGRLRSRLAEKYGFNDKMMRLNPDDTKQYPAILAGTNLARLVGGGNNGAYEAGMGLASEALKSWDGKDFGKLMEGLRAQYAKAGIANKGVAYLAANDLYAKGSIDNFDLLNMQRTFDMMYDKNGAKIYRDMLPGRERGKEAGRKDRGRSRGSQGNNVATPGSTLPMQSRPAAQANPGGVASMPNKSNINFAAQNKQRYSPGGVMGF